MNEAVDAISRNNISHLLQVLPGAQQHPIPIPGQALRMLVEDQPDWTSRNWTEITGAYLSPKGSLVSTKMFPCHSIPRSSLSAG